MAENMDEFKGEETKKGERKKTGFKKGSGTIHIRVLQRHQEQVPDEFTQGYGPYYDVLTKVADRTHNAHIRELGPDAMELVDWRSTTLKMGNLLLAKKLATAVTDYESSRYASIATVAKLSMRAPNFLTDLVNGYGPVRTPEVAANHFGGAGMAVNALGRALSGDQVAGRPVDLVDSWFLNTDWDWSSQALFDYCIGIINGWASNQPAQQMQIGNAQVTMGVPVIARGIAAYRALFGNLQGITALVVRALHVAEYLEHLIQGGQLDAGMVQALGQHNVHVVVWNRTAIQQLHGEYTLNVERSLGVFGTVMPWGPVVNLSKTGEPWQLVGLQHTDRCEGPYALTGGNVDRGYMMSEERRFYHTNRAYTLLNHEMTPTVMRTFWVSDQLKF